MVTLLNGNIFRLTGPLWGEFTNHRWIPPTKAGLMFSLICATTTNGWVNNRDAGDLRRHRSHYGVTVMWVFFGFSWRWVAGRFLVCSSWQTDTASTASRPVSIVSHYDTHRVRLIGCQLYLLSWEICRCGVEYVTNVQLVHYKHSWFTTLKLLASLSIKPTLLSSICQRHSKFRHRVTKYLNKDI